ncbi:hypothetical protein AGMMS49983_21940 [Clostridia bacterium]|nr:hypothetical protein AGMMS49983_21940 [Clostridia bacterium]
MNAIDDIKKILRNADFTQFKEAIYDYNINEFDKFGNNILHYYVLNSKDISLDCREVIGFLLSSGIDINTKQPSGQFQRTPLQQAVVMNLRDIFDFLLTKGADVNATDRNGNSILSNAVFNYLKDKPNYEYYINSLLEYGADPHKENNYGHSAYASANQYDNSDVRKLFVNC